MTNYSKEPAFYNSKTKITAHRCWWYFFIWENRECTTFLTFLPSSLKNSLALFAIKWSSSTIQMASSLIWPFTFTMSFKIKWVNTIIEFFLTSVDSSLNLKKNLYINPCIFVTTESIPPFIYYRQETLTTCLITHFFKKQL